MWAARRLRCAPAQRAKRTACAFWRRGTLRARSSMGRLPPSIAGLLVEIDHGVQDRNLNARRTRRGRQSSTRLVRGCRAPARSGSLARRSTYPSAWPAALAARGLSSTIVCDSEGMPVSARVAPPRRWRASVGRCRLGWCSASAATRGPRAVVERLALLREQFRAGALVRQPALLPGRARPPVRRAREREVSPHAAVSSGRPPRRGQPGRAVKAAYRGANPPPGLITGLTPHGDHPIDEVGVEQQAALSSAPLRCPGRSGSLPELGSPTAPVWLFAPCR
jgi:hypothetical protein